MLFRSGVAAGGGGGGGGASLTGAAGGGGAGPFFLHPAANSSSDVAIMMAVNCLLLILKSASSIPVYEIVCYLLQTGISLRPWVVNCFKSFPSAIMVHICIDPLRLEANTMCRPSGAHVGFSLRPAPNVNCTYSRVATSITKILKLPGSYPLVQANAIWVPFGCHAGLDA